jgi:uncharacterized membrane protein
MGITVETIIDAPVHSVWSAVTDIPNSANIIRGVEKVEVLDEGKDGLVGFRWKETRTMYGKTAEETMTITESAKNSHYITEARSHGSVYTSRISVRETDGKTRLAMDMTTAPVSLSAKILWFTLGFLFSGATRKALQQDLEDIKDFVEKQGKG